MLIGNILLLQVINRNLTISRCQRTFPSEPSVSEFSLVQHFNLYNLIFFGQAFRLLNCHLQCSLAWHSVIITQEIYQGCSCILQSWAVEELSKGPFLQTYLLRPPQSD